MPFVQGNAEVEYGSRRRRTTIYGAGPGMPEAFKMEVRSGRFLPEDDPTAPRALAVFRSAGIDAVAAPTDYQIVAGGEPAVLNWLPDLGALGTFTEVYREHLGLFAYRLRGWISDEEWNQI